ncbi:hypothetical protein HanXRQr2_Chr02g0076461 [Helianthus annuus]|uniref:Uncharacterized protein n=1 Tax=Helianthus annuus TaxID=4232 RepID=A0A9K3P0C5_HELAN|nr:hypothetical protein HanXRQr2_Chr02g0076461 [Helianthus annuus]KAJ0952597.1 hypothetical protein HanPSC8_Chr02g0074171 [Helianthus annuus]
MKICVMISVENQIYRKWINKCWQVNQMLLILLPMFILKLMLYVMNLIQVSPTSFYLARS